jgi:chemotaxis protein CheD
MKPGEQMARMGEYAVSRDAGARLTALGLGSCIGLALVDRRTGVAGLAHIVLPSGTPTAEDPPVKYAPTGVRFLVEQLVASGARRSRLEAVLVGGASMFATSPSAGLEVGQRNETSVRAELGRARIAIVACATGGNRGRTMRVYLDGCRITAKVAGGTEETLVEAITAGAAA